MKKTILSLSMLAGALVLASCSDQETTKELRIETLCNTSHDLCKFELTNAVVSRQTNLLGKTIERTISQSPLQNIQGAITWESTGSLADNADVENQFGSSCEDGSCTDTSNPTAYNFGPGPNSISVSGNVTVDGISVDLAKVPTVTIYTIETAPSHVFNTGSDPAIANGDTIELVAEKLNENSSSANGTFSVEGGALKITCDQDYVWIVDQDPEWGSNSKADREGFSFGRDYALAYFIYTQGWHTSGGQDSDNTVLAASGGEVFAAGCWPVS